ncbi:Ribonucleases P/MRP protein subunit-like protein [Hapsidospora chrysogenum ATCC 11550]|uniref:Ribonucleases P/MRP protein subunit-like protein n=1 Tax=Hapsidospora chrysogenum (strain ATCC 11550 / CBS 779.69 / DSM 880 / IAM 14645 / JCM 23072 / IMI 49137) TaxID=857340 RepID=A0A086T1Q6_HAPC1|nr:Ribonucleases P/MRP protein subunit-like protein [Hapsidospora chrysogenum ATCC 11550]
MPPKPGPGDSAAGSGSNKRKAAQQQTPSGRGERRDKLHLARAVPAQRAEAALKDGELDLQAFVAAHEFEIRSLEQSMATSKATGSTRAFQRLPRGLRRRTASHNPKRVPKRLRSRAVKEAKQDKTPTVESRKGKPRTTRARIRAETAKRLGILAERKRRKRLKRAEAAGASPDSTNAIGKDDGAAVRKPRAKIRRNLLNEPPTPPAKFRKRQLDKTWLPTHVWHAKRARMTAPKEPLWRFSLPLTPNEKVYRPVHRTQGDRGAVMWDASYMSTIGLYGNQAGIERALRRIGVSQENCWNDKGRRWRMGCRSWSGMLSRETSRGRQQMCPSSIFWNPVPSDHEPNNDSTKKKRELFLRVHPSAFLEVFNELVRRAKMETPQLYVEDLRYEVGSIDITGPASTEALLSVLTPYSTPQQPKAAHAGLFQSLNGLTNPSALPANAMLGFAIQDPRLRYPPRKPSTPEGEDEEMRLLETIAEWPVESGTQPYGLFNRNARHAASLLPSQKFIDRRRSRITPGASLKPGVGDPPIPVILLASRSGSSTQTQGTWTLLAPWSCILPVWHSLVHCPLSSGGNPRFGGLNETRQVAFERGLAWFPADYPATAAGVEWEREQRRTRERAWAKRPKSKRVEWESLDLGAGRKGEVGNGLACDYELLYGLPPLDKADEEEPPSKPVDEDAMDVDTHESAPPKKAKDDPLHLVTVITKNTFNQLISSPDSTSPLPLNATLTVRITVLSRGTVGPCARIYRLPSTPLPAPTSSNAEVPATIPPQSSSSPSTRLPHNLRAQWLDRIPPSKTPSRQRPNQSKITKSDDMETRKRMVARELLGPPSTPFPPPKPNTTDIGGHPLVPDAVDLVGFVTTGSFCLSEGMGMAIGSVAVDKVLPDVRADGKEGRLCVVRNAGENVGWLARWEAI